MLEGAREGEPGLYATFSDATALMLSRRAAFPSFVCRHSQDPSPMQLEPRVHAHTSTTCCMGAVLQTYTVMSVSGHWTKSCAFHWIGLVS